MDGSSGSGRAPLLCSDAASLPIGAVQERFGRQPQDLAESPVRRKITGMDSFERSGLGWRITLLVVYLLLGQAIGYRMGWTPVVSLYYTSQTLTTVGFGDFSFADASKDTQLMVAIFVLMGVFVMGVGLAVIFERVLEHEQRAFDDIVPQSLLPKESDTTPGHYIKPTLAVSATFVFQKARRRLQINLVLCVCIFAAMIIIGASLVGYIEDWDWRTSFYWSCVTLTSVGYGDVVPSHTSSRLAATVLMSVGVLVVGGCAGFIGGYSAVVRDLQVRQKVLTQFGTGLLEEDLEVLADGEEVRGLGLSQSDQFISRAEFCLFMLLKLGRVSEEELRASQAAFDCLDRTADGRLQRLDLVQEVERRSGQTTLS